MGGKPGGGRNFAGCKSTGGRSGVGSSCMTGRIFFVFKMVAISNNAFLVKSPACSDTVVVDGGAVSRVIMSVAV